MTLVERKQREREQRRNDILSVAEKLFLTRGYDNVSMDEIANDVELSRATLYLYFKDKESLFFAIVNRGTKILCSLIREEIKRVGGNKLGLISEVYGRFMQDYPDYARVY